MKNTKYILGGIMIFVAILLGTYWGVNKQDSQPVSYGSIGVSGYKATTTDQFGAVVAGNYKVLKNIHGILGSVVITNSTAGSFNLYDATTTNHSDHATTTLAQISPSLAAGTYTFDVAFSRGLIVEFQSTNVASSTITYQ